MKIKKILSFVLLAAVATASLITVASAASLKIEGFDDTGYGPTLEDMFSYGQDGNPGDLEVTQGEEIRIPLTMGMFSWSDEGWRSPMQAITVNNLRGVKVHAQKVSGSDTLDYVQFDTDTFSGSPFLTNGPKKTGRTAYISVMFTREFVGIEDQNFEYDIYLSIDRKKTEEYKIKLSGKMLADLKVVDKNTDYANMADGMVVEAMERVSNINLDAGNGLTINTNLLKDKRYYATCNIVDSRSEMESELDYLPVLYPEIECIYKLKTINITKGSTYAKIELPNAEGVVHHVYSEDLQYLGTTADELAFSPMYIVCTERLPALEEIDYENVTKEIREAAKPQPGDIDYVQWTPKYIDDSNNDTEAQ